MVEIMYDASIGSVGIPLNNSQIDAVIAAAEEMGISRIAIKELFWSSDGLNRAVSFPYLCNRADDFEKLLWSLQKEYKNSMLKSCQEAKP